MHCSVEDKKFVIDALTNSAPLVGPDFLASTVSSMWVASGLAKITAAYGASLVRRFTGNPSVMLSPLEYCNTPRLRGLPLLVSLRGEHPDAVAVAHSIAAREERKAVMLTCDPSGPAASTLVANGLSRICSAQLPPRDTRFVNCRSIFALSSLAHRLVQQALGKSACISVDPESIELFYSTVHERARDMAAKITAIDEWRRKQVIILCDGHTSALGITWQSVLAEAGICTPTCLDLKDYTHGDHLAASQTSNVVFIVLQHAEIETIADVFVQRFQTIFPLIAVHLTTNFNERFWENLFICCEVTNLLSVHLGYEGGRPPKNPTVHGWRGWGDIGTHAEPWHRIT